MRIQLSMFFITALLSLGLMQVGCNGYRYRTVESSATSDEASRILQRIRASLGAVGANSNPQEVQALETFFTIWDLPDSTLYFAEAPSIQGEIHQVFSGIQESINDLVSPNSVRIGNITRMYAFFVLANPGDGLRGALLLAGNSNDGTPTAGPTVPPLGTPGPFATPGQTPVPQDDVAINFAFIGKNDGRAISPFTKAALPPAEISGKNFDLDLNMKDSLHLILKSHDVIDNDLAVAVQFELYNFVNNQEVYMGLLNMAAPE